MLPKRQHSGFQEVQMSVNDAKTATKTEIRSKTCRK